VSNARAGAEKRTRRHRDRAGAGVMAAPFDVLTMGRVGVDVYPLQTGVEIDDRFTGYDAAAIDRMGFNGGKIVAGRSLLYPPGGDVAAAVDTAVGLL
jgi:hypothetical protein